ncbi:MAG TPA: ABC transporter permease [Myxococcales bacterium]|jgi:phospholipid/cholesterol/gamma-HCH transport system permease protein
MPEDAPTTRPPAEALRPLHPARLFVESLGRGFLSFVHDVGGIATLFLMVVRSVVVPPWRLGLVFGQMDFLGVGSTSVVILTGLFTGMVMTKQSLVAFAMFNAESLVGPTVTISITRELAPVFAALMITMRAGSAMSTELGTMRVTEQIDALVTIAVDPVKYLIYPRVVAGMLMAPVLCMVFDGAGVAGTWFVAIIVEGLSPGTFLTKTQEWVDPGDIYLGLIKSVFFGLLITLIACYKGFNAKGGAKGVGQATTEAMVMTAVSTFVIDYVLNLIFLPILFPYLYR